MNVTIFKNARETLTGYHKNVFYALNRIKTGQSKEYVEKLRQMPFDEYQENKKNLPSVCYCGTFNNRSTKGLIKKSGLIILDFDKFESKEKTLEYKNILVKNEYIFSCWISPSALGVKALIKIPINEKHKEYFDALNKHFKSSHFDEMGSDVARLCFESYDPDLYINENSTLWVETEEPEYVNIGTEKPTVPMVSENAIIDNLLKWWQKKYSNAKGQRNSNIFILASAFNDFGINKREADRVLMQFQEKDFTQREIEQLINSAYKKTAQHGTKFFEDDKLKQQIYKQIITGKKSKEIIKNIPEIKEEVIEKCITSIKDSISIDTFWDFTDDGKLVLSPHRYKFWLQQNNYFKYFPNDSNTYTYIFKEQNLIEETNEKRIKDFVLSELLHRKDDGFIPYDHMARNTKYFTSDFLSMLESANVELKQDTATECFLYYKNCVLKVTKDSIEKIDYIDIDGYVWKKQIIDRDFEEVDYANSEYAKFIELISGQEESKCMALISVIGYLLHSYKTSANNKAIIFNDETISDNPSGGSGKGLFWNALAKMKKVSRIDGKTFEFTKSFPYQTVSTDTQILVFDDVKKNFAFENLFSLITEGITLEYKGQDALTIPVEKSPKIIITTNYTIRGVGGSFERRKYEVELSSYFNSNHAPLDEFGHMLFDDWSRAEWLKFDNFMIFCCQYYMKNGLLPHSSHNLELRKFINETSHEFYEWVQDDNISVDVTIDKKECFDRFTSEYNDLKKYLTQKRFSMWLDRYGEFNNFKITKGKTHGQRWISYSKQ